MMLRVLNECVQQHRINEESRTIVPEVIKSMNQQDDDDMYEPKSVRDLKAMFNKPSKPHVPGQSMGRSILPVFTARVSFLVQ